MATYTGSGNFSSNSTEIYRLDVTVVTTHVTGGTQLNVSATATMVTQPAGVTPAFSSSGSRTYNVPEGRTTSTSGSKLESGSATWSYDFTGGAGTTQTVWGGFNRFISYADSASLGYNGSVTITATGSGSTYLQTASVTVSNISLFSASYDYQIDYLGNGATGGSTSSTIATSSSTSYNLTVASNGFTRTGYTFTGWNTSSGGGGTSYSPGQTVTLTSGSPTLTLYAQWEQIVPVWSNGLTNYTTVRVGDSFSDYLYASNATSYSLVTGPSGVYVQDYGSYAYLFGTVNATTSGTRTITVRATADGGGYADVSDTFSLRQALPVWTDTSLADGRKGTSYSSSFSATNATNWVISGVPSGLSTSGTSGATVTVSGTPTVYGNYTVTATPYQSDGDAGTTQYISISIDDVTLSWSDQLLASSTVVQNQSYSDGVSVVAGPTTTYSIASGSLPAGITLNTSTGAITGTPTTPGSYSFVIRATNGTSETLDTNTLSITVEVAGGYAKVWNGSSWVEGTAYVYNGSTWVEGTVQISNGAGWTDSFST